jgi:hypothetical protein
MESPRAPSPVRGLAVALILGVVLAAAAVGFLTSVPSSIQFTGASQNSQSTNETMATPGGQTNASAAASSNATSVPATSVGANSTSPSFVSVNDIAAAISKEQPASVANSSLSGGASSNASSTYLVYSQERSATVATAWRDLAIFAAAGALALGAFLLSRRQMS